MAGASRSGRPDGSALVLSGGAALGAVQVGILKALFAAGFRPSFIVGTSVGALNGGFIAFHPDESGLLELEQIWQELRDAEVFSRNPLRMAYNFAVRRQFLWENTPLRSIIARHTQVDDFAAAEIPFYAVATNLTRGTKHIFSEGKVSTALLASTAIPGFLSPVEIDGETFVDGGVLASLDLATAVDLGAKQILAIDIGGPSAFRRPRSFLGVLGRSIELMSRELVAKDVTLLAGRADVTIIRINSALRMWWGDFRHVSKLIALAERIGEEMIGCCLADGQLVPGIVNQFELVTGFRLQQITRGGDRA